MNNCKSCSLNFAAGVSLVLGWMCWLLAVGVPAVSESERGVMLLLGLVLMVGAVALVAKAKETVPRRKEP